MGVSISSDEEIASQAAVDSLKQTLEVAVTTSEFLDLQPFHYVFETVILKQFSYLIQYSSIPDDELITMNTALSNLWSNKLKIEIPSTRLALPLEKGGLRCHMSLYHRDTLKLRSLKHLARDVRGVFPSGIGAFLKNLQASNASKHFMDLLHTAAWVEFHLSDPGFGDTSQEMEHDETRDENENEVQSLAISGEQSEILTGPPGLDVENDVSSSGQDSHHSPLPDPPGDGTSTIVSDSQPETVQQK
eukprot:gnl/Carplike_NY0171/2094_a2818_788.p1 GENE.gnl/Carplike_NY0171/2094_a2818_788~~gnl/Carplike_NY0171/2094_a2818_788.p1  ORF type:complete len:246 (-),score=41.93 gnl/Carplike_NY0171/2094_a2818_788:146-883(-)